MDELLRNVTETLQIEELEKLLGEGKQLVIKCGFDPTAADLHLGHFVVLSKLRDFQDMGHIVKFVVGDFTGMIGDPSGRDITRPPISREDLRANAESYAEQAFKVLKREATEIVFNSEWLEKLSFADILRLSSQYTVARMLERDDFSKRHSEGRAIGIHEFLYPLMQAYDSVVLSCDVEIGGTDQKFNLLVGRHLQKAWDQKPQVVMMMPILVGLDGVRKMSKSLDNYIGIDEDPATMFGKIMSLSDETMWEYFDLLSRLSGADIKGLQAEAEQGKNPRDIKMGLAYELVTRFHDATVATLVEEEFVQRFRHGILPEDMETCEIEIEKGTTLPLFKVLQMSALTSSSSEANRMIKQGAVKISGAKVEDPNTQIDSNQEKVYQVGKRKFMKIVLRNKPV